MFIVNLHYIAPLDEIDRHMTEHVKFLQACYKQNIFIASGRKVPRTGGVILALGKSMEEIDRLMRQDPFIVHGLAEFTITEFLTSQTHPEIKKALKAIGASIS